ncbi:ROK family transcriptional regulator [Paenibacillus sp. SYP-B3998]|uniref:ROK family transcriptional regulator n=1 Tax=Paenibacillus sp. SYP-B3998 TaxID=2678564 RepID=A0A6G4A3F4_9BACL|nr:ROK family transcriptional regulator [Paenibacillus sp. SYP-B3998]NEW08351.1 ROK family transcriptional regulator [Paenibacillus sp. SYP-B3998]
MKKIEKHDQDVIRLHNKQMILEIIKKKRPISRAEITKITKLSPTSVGRIVAELCEQGLVRETALTSVGVGRKAIMLDIDPQAVYTFGVDIGKKAIKFGVMEFSGKLLHEQRVEHIALQTTPEVTASVIFETINLIIENKQLDKSKIIGIGIGVPGVIDHERGIVQYSSTLGWRAVPIARLIQDKLPIPTVIDNDLKVKILAEFLLGSARGSKKTALIELGSGVGSSLIIDGEIFRGGSNSAGELGHTTLDPNGNLCECGKRGCLQTYIDESAILHEANRIKETTDIEQLFAAVQNEENWAQDIISRTSLYIGIAINNIVCMYNPDAVILCGDLVEKHSEIVPLIEEQCAQVVWEPFRDTFKILTSELKAKSIVVGAAMLVMNGYVDKSI